MSFATVVIAFVGVSGLVLAALAAFGFYRIMRPTKGSRIKLRWPARSALLVIDMQEELLAGGRKRSYPREASEATIEVVREVISRVRAQEMPVIYVRQEFSDLSTRLVSRLLYGGLGCEGRPGIRIDPRMPPGGDNTFTKPFGDAFSNPELERYLASLNVGELYLVGLDGITCVHRTACGARNRGYKVNFIVDGILTAFPKKWEALLEEHVRRGATALPSSELDAPPSSRPTAGARPATPVGGGAAAAVSGES